MTNEEKIKILKSLFKGREDAYGLFNPETEEFPKIDGPVNDELIDRHINGKISISIFPIKPNENTCSFGVLDLDLSDMKLVKSIVMSFDYFGIQFYLEKSKSKGYHFHVFPEKPILASKVIRLLEIVKRHSLVAVNDKAEIFPKQEKVEEGKYGFGVHLPFNKFVSDPFLDPENGFKPFEDQWGVLKDAKRIKEEEIDKITGNNKEMDKIRDEIKKEIIKPEANLEFTINADLLNSNAQINWIIKSLIPTDSLSMLVGEPKSFKTWILMEMAKCVARGNDFLGNNDFQTEKGGIVYIDGENGRGVLTQRAKALGIKDNDQIMYLIRSYVDFYSDLNTKALKEKIEKLDPVLIIIDNLIGAHSAPDENSSTEMMKVFKNIKSLLSPKRGIIASHHYGYGPKRLRGTSAMRGDLASEINITKLQKQLKIDQKYTRHEKIEPFFVDIDYNTEKLPCGFRYSRKAIVKKTCEQEVIEILKKKEVGVDELIEELGEGRTKIDKAIKGMLGKEIEISKVIACGKKIYRIKT